MLSITESDATALISAAFNQLMVNWADHPLALTTLQDFKTEATTQTNIQLILAQLGNVPQSSK